MSIYRADLETGDLSQFDSTTASNGTLAVNAGAAAHGLYGLETNATADGANLQANFYSNLGEEFWFAYYFKVDSAFTQNDGNRTRLMRIMNDTYTKDIYYLRLQTKDTPSGTLGLSFLVPRDPGGFHYLPGDGNNSYAIVANVWRHIEVHFKRASTTDAADGEVDFWVDGGLVGSNHTVDAYDNLEGTGMFRTYCRCFGADTRGKLYFDDIVVSNEGRIYPTYRPRRFPMTGGLVV